MLNKILKKTVMTLLSVILLLLPVNVYGLESQTNQWENDYLISPQTSILVPAGPIELKWKKLEDQRVESYEIYFDDHLEAIVNNYVTTYTVYSTEVSLHEVKINAILDNSEKVEGNTKQFYISKKGIAYDNPEEIQNLSAAWYYNWGTSSSIDTDLEYTPMVWGSGNESSQIKQIKNSGYHTILGYNEPEGTLSGQSQVDVETAVNQQYLFSDSGLRVGSPAVEHLSSLLDTNSWFSQYMNKINQDDIDFIAVHEYLYNVCNCSDVDNTKKIAKEFLMNLEKVYEKYHKPIWITELGIVNHDVNWKHYSYSNVQGRNEVYNFLRYIIEGVDGVKGLDDLEFVERYAWFPFDMGSTSAGASSLFVTQTDYKNDISLKLGSLNDLGKLYRDLGNPKGYIPSNLKIAKSEIHVSQNVKEVTYTGLELRPSIVVTFEGENLQENVDYTIVGYKNNVNSGNQAVVTIQGQGRFVGQKSQMFTIGTRDINCASCHQIPVQRYTGNNIEPTIILKDGQKTLIKDQDYKVSYTNNKRVGDNTACIKVIGIGNYGGTKRIYFSIQQLDNPITSVSLNQTTASLYKGKSVTLKATIYPSDTTDSKTLIWTSSNPNVATVSSTGVVKGISAGTAKITVKTSNGKTATCTVTVKNPTLSLNYTNKTLNKGSTLTLKVTATPTGTVTYKTSNPSVATVTNQGVIKAVNGGKATITVTVNGISKTCTITVPYTITYKLNGGTNNKDNPKSYYGKKITLKNPTRKGYTFNGWYSQSTYKTKVTQIAKGSTGNKTLYAKWTKVSVATAKTPTLTNVKGKKLKITYKATTGAKGYQIQYSTNKNFSKATSKNLTGKSATYTLTKGKTYYVRVRAYKLDSTGTKVYGKWSTVKNKKITK